MSSLLRESRSDPKPCTTLPPEETDHGEDFLGLPSAVYPEETDCGEVLLELPAVEYPEETEDLQTKEMHQEKAVGSGPGKTDFSPVVLLEDVSACFSGIPADPVVGSFAIFRVLGWDPLE